MPETIELGRVQRPIRVLKASVAQGRAIAKSSLLEARFYLHLCFFTGSLQALSFSMSK